MTFDEAFAAECGSRPGIEVSICGHLVACELFAYLSEGPLIRYDDPSGRVILIADANVSSALLNVGCPMAVGGMVMFSGRATVSARLFRSGLSVFPLAFSIPYRLKFIDDDGTEYDIEKKT